MSDILKALKFMHPRLGVDAGCVVELCASGCNGYSPLWEGLCAGKEGMVAGWFDNPQALEKVADALNAGWTDRGGNARYPKAIYITVNQVDDALLGRAANRIKPGVARSSDKDVARYTNIFIDIDAKRPSGVSASDEEKRVSIQLVKEVRAYLQNEQFWPDPLVADSGNGAHLVYKSAIIASPENTKLVKEFLKALAEKFERTTVKGGREVVAQVDTSVHNPSRLVKLYGTTTRKGDATTTRPHRISGVMYVPEGRQDPITPAQLQAVIDTWAKEKGSTVAAGVSEPPASAASSASGGDRGRDSRSSHSVPQSQQMFTSVTGIEPIRQGGTLRVDEYLAHYGVEVVDLETFDEGGVKYRLKYCLFDASHQHPDCYIGQQPDGLVYYHCSHNSCQEYTWKDARTKISGDVGLGRFMEGGSFGIEFPHINDKGKPYARVENFIALLNGYGIQIRYNEMSKTEEYRLPGGLWSNADRLNSLALHFIRDLCARHGLANSKDNLQAWTEMVAEAAAYHPVKEWIESYEWDGVSRFDEVVNTVEVPEEQKQQWRTYLRRWLIQGVAALYERDFGCRGVLTFTGDQGIGKTSWFKSLAPKTIKAVADGLHLDPADPDSVLTVLSRWIVELGEVDATFRKADVSRLKSFITKQQDDFRRKYGRKHEHWKRATVFGATVNDPQFLVDATGNTRFWVIETLNINWEFLRDEIDMQQVWAEVKTMYEMGESWFLNEEETRRLNALNKQFEVVDPIEEAILDTFRFDVTKDAWSTPMTTTEILKLAGFTTPNKGQTTKAAVYLRKLAGKSEMKRVGGRHGRFYLMPPTSANFDGFVDVTQVEKKPAKVIQFGGEDER